MRAYGYSATVLIYSMTGTVSGVTDVATVVDNMVKQRIIDNDLVGIAFEPTSKNVSKNGEVTFGGVDPKRFFEPLVYT